VEKFSLLEGLMTGEYKAPGTTGLVLSGVEAVVVPSKKGFWPITGYEGKIKSLVEKLVISLGIAFNTLIIFAG
jgi:hypothetical protein